MITIAALRAWLSPKRTALLIIDMQVDFAAPDGKVAAWGADLSNAPGAIAAAERLAASSRAAGVPVIFIGMQTAPETDSPAWGERLRRRGDDPAMDLALCRRGEPGAAFYGPQPQAADLVLFKTRFSAFHGVDLNARLRALGADTLLICGMTTECCVDCTVRDAFHLDYHVFLVGDACAAYEPDLHQSALKTLGLSCAILVTTAEVEAALARPI